MLLASTLTAAELTIAMASDMAPLQAELASSFQRDTAHRVRFVLGSSGMLAQQIRHGAPFDAFLSANRRYVEELAEAGRIGEWFVYAIGRLGLVGARSLEDLKTSTFRNVAIANPVHAPYGVAAREALQKAGVWEAVSPRIVLAENVRQALQFQESGNVDAAIVAWSLVRDRAVEVPSNLHAPIEQACGVVRTSRRQREALAFIHFLKSEPIRRLLARYGFVSTRVALEGLGR